MSTDYFANAVYGIPLTNTERTKLEDLLDKYYESHDREDSDEVIVNDGMSRVFMAFRGRLIKKYGTPESVWLISTGSDDDRVGRSQTGPGEWILGYGYLSFPEVATELTEKFRSQAEWFSWVTYG